MTKDNLAERDVTQKLLDRVCGLDNQDGNARLKAILRDLLDNLCYVMDKHDVTEDELWAATGYLAEAGPELGLIVPGLGLEHYMDALMDENDRRAGVGETGTPRTIEGPLFVEGAPLSDYEATMSDEEEDGERLIIHGTVRDLDGNPVPGALMDMWHANLSGFYSHFDPTNSQVPFNNRRKIRTDENGRYRAITIMPSGYSVPPEGPTDKLLKLLGRHGSRPAHVHYFVRADGFRHLTTQINIADDPLVHDDFAYATRDELIPDLNRSDDGAEIQFDIELAPSSIGQDYQMSHRKRLQG